MEDFDSDHLASLVRLMAWSKIDNSRMIDLELRRLNLYSLPMLLQKKSAEAQAETKENIHLLQAQIIQGSQNHLMTFRYIYNLLNNNDIRFTRNVLDLLYPRPYLDVLRKNLKNQDPLLVLSLIRQESVFNPQARSPVGARGLMQLMPATAKQMRRSVKVNQLSNPKVNIELGTKYFQGLMKRYDGNLVYVLSAYNAGETRVKRWQKSYFDEEETIVRNIETIPFKETRTYVKLIFRNLFFYKLLTHDELIDNKENNKIFNVNLGFKH
jgi:soluble lytic murein transglycosylase